MQVATRAIAAIGQYLPFGISTDLENFPTGAQMISGVEEARRAVREQIGHGADLIKVYADWSYATLTVDEMRVIVEEAHQQRRKVAAHGITTEGIRNAVTAGVDSIEHCVDPDRVTLETMKKQGIFLVSTAYAALGPKDAAKSEPARSGFAAQDPPISATQRGTYMRRFEILKKTIALARDVGVKIASGMDATSASTHGKNARELTALASLGMPAIEVIQTATTNAAELLGWSDRVGVLAPKMFADIIAVEGNPLTDITTLERVKFVMKGGVVVVSGSSHGRTAGISTTAPE
jgi:imidazolonepropionase-like amidohydrolase